MGKSSKGDRPSTRAELVAQTNYNNNPDQWVGPPPKGAEVQGDQPAPAAPVANSQTSAPATSSVNAGDSKDAAAAPNTAATGMAPTTNLAKAAQPIVLGDQGPQKSENALAQNVVAESRSGTQLAAANTVANEDAAPEDERRFSRSAMPRGGFTSRGGGISGILAPLGRLVNSAILTG